MPSQTLPSYPPKLHIPIRENNVIVSSNSHFCEDETRYINFFINRMHYSSSNVIHYVLHFSPFLIYFVIVHIGGR